MKTLINDRKFKSSDKKFINFFNEHGWVVLENALTNKDANAIQSQYKEMKIEYAMKANIPLANYELQITQWRDLWLRNGAFRKCIFNEVGIHGLVQRAMGWVGVKLLHDHIITKPPEVKASTIPWHQDSMFWPINKVGCSALTAISDVFIESGCLEVIDYSHLNGCEAPLDFMSKEKTDFNENSTCIQLPLNAGDSILLHSLCWHRSSINQTQKDRPLHISLWIDPSALWRPDLVDWHPINDNVESKPNEELRGRMFPVFGTYQKTPTPQEEIHTGTTPISTEISMFNATSIVLGQIRYILKTDSQCSLAKLLETEDVRQEIVNRVIDRQFYDNEKDLTELLYNLWICASSYEDNRSRNVFNSAFAEWNNKVGKSIQAILNN